MNALNIKPKVNNKNRTQSKGNARPEIELQAHKSDRRAVSATRKLFELSDTAMPGSPLLASTVPRVRAQHPQPFSCLARRLQSISGIVCYANIKLCIVSCHSKHCGGLSDWLLWTISCYLCVLQMI